MWVCPGFSRQSTERGVVERYHEALNGPGKRCLYAVKDE